MKSAGLKGTVSIELVHEAIRAAALRNMDISGVLEIARLDRDLLSAPRARIPAAAYSRMWVALADLMDVCARAGMKPGRPTPANAASACPKAPARSRPAGMGIECLRN